MQPVFTLGRLALVLLVLVLDFVPMGSDGMVQDEVISDGGRGTHGLHLYDGHHWGACFLAAAALALR